MALLQRPKGTEDVLPATSAEWIALEDFLRRTALCSGFREIRVPTFEETELFSRGVGETTDVVQKEMYNVSASGDATFTLRPEGTAGTIRAVLEHGLLNEALPQRLYYILSCFRHENTQKQKGRLREFHQFGVEMAGSSHPSADAEVISLAKQVIDDIGIKNVELRINSIGCPECRKKYQEALKAYFQPHHAELCQDCKSRLERNPMRLLDCKVPDCQQIGKGAPEILDYLCEDCSNHFEKLKQYLGLLGIVYTIDPRIVRGLDYYTKTVFEFVIPVYNEKQKKQETLTVCGGGRYDGLIEQLGGQPTPALGFGMGLERLLMTLHQQGKTLAEPSKCDIYFVPMGEQAEEKALQLTMKLRKDGTFALTDVMGRGLRAQMKYADKIGARFTMVIGDNELESGEAVLKNMQTGEKITMKLDDTLPERFADIEIADRLAKE